MKSIQLQLRKFQISARINRQGTRKAVEKPGLPPSLTPPLVVAPGGTQSSLVDSVVPPTMGIYNRVSQYRKTAEICAVVRQLRAFFSQTATVSLLALFILLLLLLLILTLS